MTEQEKDGFRQLRMSDARECLLAAAMISAANKVSFINSNENVVKKAFELADEIVKQGFAHEPI